jgi:hypothetical protein
MFFKKQPTKAVCGDEVSPSVCALIFATNRSSDFREKPEFRENRFIVNHTSLSVVN